MGVDDILRPMDDIFDMVAMAQRSADLRVGSIAPGGDDKGARDSGGRGWAVLLGDQMQRQVDAAGDDRRPRGAIAAGPASAPGLVAVR